MIVNFTGLSIDTKDIEYVYKKSSPGNPCWMGNEPIPSDWERINIPDTDINSLMKKHILWNYLHKLFPNSSFKYYMWYNVMDIRYNVVIAFSNPQDMMIFKLRNCAEELRELWNSEDN